MCLFMAGWQGHVVPLHGSSWVWNWEGWAGRPAGMGMGAVTSELGTGICSGLTRGLAWCSPGGTWECWKALSPGTGDTAWGGGWLRAGYSNVSALRHHQLPHPNLSCTPWAGWNGVGWMGWKG